MGRALERNRKTAGKRRKPHLHRKISFSSGFGGRKDLVLKLDDHLTRNKGITILVDDAMFQRTLQQPPVAGTRSRSVYRQAAKKVLAGQDIKVVRASKPTTVPA